MGPDRTHPHTPIIRDPHNKTFRKAHPQNPANMAPPQHIPLSPFSTALQTVEESDQSKITKGNLVYQHQTPASGSERQSEPRQTPGPEYDAFRVNATRNNQSSCRYGPFQPQIRAQQHPSQHNSPSSVPRPTHNQGKPTGSGSTTGPHQNSSASLRRSGPLGASHPAGGRGPASAKGTPSTSRVEQMQMQMQMSREMTPVRQASRPPINILAQSPGGGIHHHPQSHHGRQGAQLHKQHSSSPSSMSDGVMQHSDREEIAVQQKEKVDLMYDFRLDNRGKDQHPSYDGVLVSTQTDTTFLVNIFTLQSCSERFRDIIRHSLVGGQKRDSDKCYTIKLPSHPAVISTALHYITKGFFPPETISTGPRWDQMYTFAEKYGMALLKSALDSLLEGDFLESRPMELYAIAGKKWVKAGKGVEWARHQAKLADEDLLEQVEFIKKNESEESSEQWRTEVVDERERLVRVAKTARWEIELAEKEKSKAMKLARRAILGCSKTWMTVVTETERYGIWHELQRDTSDSKDHGELISRVSHPIKAAEDVATLMGWVHYQALISAFESIAEMAVDHALAQWEAELEHEDTDLVRDVEFGSELWEKVWEKVEQYVKDHDTSSKILVEVQEAQDSKIWSECQQLIEYGRVFTTTLRSRGIKREPECQNEVPGSSKYQHRESQMRQPDENRPNEQARRGQGNDQDQEMRMDEPRSTSAHGPTQRDEMVERRSLPYTKQGREGSHHIGSSSVSRLEKMRAAPALDVRNDRENEMQTLEGRSFSAHHHRNEVDERRSNQITEGRETGPRQKNSSHSRQDGKRRIDENNTHPRDFRNRNNTYDGAGSEEQQYQARSSNSRGAWERRDPKLMAQSIQDAPEDPQMDGCWEEEQPVEDEEDQSVMSADEVPRGSRHEEADDFYAEQDQHISPAGVEGEPYNTALKKAFELYTLEYPHDGYTLALFEREMCFHRDIWLPQQLERERAQGNSNASKAVKKQKRETHHKAKHAGSAKHIHSLQSAKQGVRMQRQVMQKQHSGQGSRAGSVIAESVAIVKKKQALERQEGGPTAEMAFENRGIFDKHQSRFAAHDRKQPHHHKGNNSPQTRDIAGRQHAEKTRANITSSGQSTSHGSELSKPPLEKRSHPLQNAHVVHALSATTDGSEDEDTQMQQAGDADEDIEDDDDDMEDAAVPGTPSEEPEARETVDLGLDTGFHRQDEDRRDSKQEADTYGYEQKSDKVHKKTRLSAKGIPYDTRGLMPGMRPVETTDPTSSAMERPDSGKLPQNATVEAMAIDQTEILETQSEPESRERSPTDPVLADHNEWPQRRKQEDYADDRSQRSRSEEC